MRKTYLHLSAVVVLMAVLLIAVAVVTAAERTTVPCEETFIGQVDPGTWTFPGGNVHIRGMVNTYEEVSPDPRNVGINTVTVNANWGPDYTGPMWGTFSNATYEGGLWEGHWNGTMTAEGSSYQAVGNGYGLYAGQKVWVDVQPGSCWVTFRD